MDDATAKRDIRLTNISPHIILVTGAIRLRSVALVGCVIWRRTACSEHVHVERTIKLKVGMGSQIRTENR